MLEIIKALSIISLIILLPVLYFNETARREGDTVEFKVKNGELVM